MTAALSGVPKTIPPLAVKSFLYSRSAMKRQFPSRPPTAVRVGTHKITFLNSLLSPLSPSRPHAPLGASPPPSCPSLLRSSKQQRGAPIQYLFEYLLQQTQFKLPFEYLLQQTQFVITTHKPFFRVYYFYN